MSARPSQPAHLSPFCLPTETDGRFRMLVASAVLAWGACLMLVVVVPAFVPAARESLLAALADIRELASVDLVRADERQLRHAAALVRRGGRAVLASLAPSLAGSAVLSAAFLAAAWVLYRLHPWHHRRRDSPRRLAPGDAPDLVGELRALANRFRRRMPALEWRPGLLGGLAYGWPGREALLLWGEPKVLAREWRGPVRAVVLHEFAHVVNGDVQKREWSKAIWIALVCCVVGLGLSSWVTPQTGGADALDLLRARPGIAFWLAGLVAVALWIWVGLVRVREYYADARAAEWGAGTELDGVLVLRAGTGRFHPLNNLRRRLVTDPRPLMRVSATVAFQAGVLLGISVSLVFWTLCALTFLVLAWFEPWFLEAAAGLTRWGSTGRLAIVVMGLVRNVTIVAPWFVALAWLIYLATRVLGLQAQREALADLVTRRAGAWRYLPLLLPAVLFAVGLEAGFLVAPLTPWIPTSGLALVRVLAWLPCWAGLNWLWLVYVRALARCVLGTRVGHEMPRLHARLVTLGSMLTLCMFFIPALFGRMTLPFAESQLLRLLPAGMPGADLPPEERYVVIAVMTTAVAFMGAIALFCVAATISMLVTAAWLRLQPRNCPDCRERCCGFAVGARCEGCGASLAPWTLQAGAEATP